MENGKFLVRRMVLAAAVAAVCIIAVYFINMPAAPKQETPAQEPAEAPPAEDQLPVFQQPLTEEQEGALKANETANQSAAENQTVVNQTAQNEIAANATANETAKPIRKPRSNYLARIVVAIGNIGYPQSLYIAQDTWARMDGVIAASLNPDKRQGTVIFADWKVSEEELIQAIRVRFTASVVRRDNCTYDLNMNDYCCDGKCVYYKNLREELS